MKKSTGETSITNNIKYKNSPKVIFNCRFNYALNHYKTKEKSTKVLNNTKNMFDYFCNEKKRAINMFDYYEGKINSHNQVNLILEDGHFATKEEVSKRKEEYIKYIENSNLWRGVISFNNEYIDSNISLQKLEDILCKKIIPNFLKKVGFCDINKMSYQLALHTNTDNYHFHFSFIEKEANYIDAKGKLTFRKIGKISPKDINYLKNEIVIEIEKEKYFTPMLKNINSEIEELKKYFDPNEKNFILENINDLEIEEAIYNLGKLLYSERKDKKEKIKFNSLRNKEIKTLTKLIKNELFKNKNSDLYHCEQKLNNSLVKMNLYLNGISKDNNIKYKNNNSIITKKKEYIDNYICNSIVNYSDDLYKKTLKENKKIKVDDIIKEICLSEYKKAKNKNRYTLLKNYLSKNTFESQFPSRYKIENILKHINKEMDKSKDEFSEMFKEREVIK